MTGGALAGIGSGLDTDASDYVARMTFQPNSQITFTSRFRFAESDFSLQRTELETNLNFDRWSTSLAYGDYAPQPAVGFLDRRQGILASAKYKLNPNWQLLGGVRYDLKAEQVSLTQIGVGYIDDCLILALNYVTSYAYSGSVTVNHTYMMQLSLRTLGGTTSTSTALISSSHATTPVIAIPATCGTAMASTPAAINSTLTTIKTRLRFRPIAFLFLPDERVDVPPSTAGAVTALVRGARE